MRWFITTCVILAVIDAGVLGARILLVKHSDQLPHATVSVNGASLSVEVATTEAELEKGLGGRASIPKDTGMLFVFGKPGRYPIWMKEMQFPIDVFWLDRFGAVTSFIEDMTPDTYPKSFPPKEDAWFVLETKSGYAAIHGISEGTKVKLPVELLAK